MINLFPPNDQQYTYLQVNRGDNIGSLWSSMNLDFQSNFGIMRVSPRLLLNLSSSGDADLGLPVNFKEFGGVLWALAGTRIWKNTAPEPNEAFAEDNSAGAQTDYDENSDLEVFDGKLWASNESGLYSKTTAAGAWSQETATPDSGLLQYFRKFNRLYIVQSDNEVHSIDDAGAFSASGDYTINLGVGTGTITCMAETSDSIWLGTIYDDDLRGQGSIFQWDGISAQASQRYYMEANEVCSMIVMEDVPYALDSFGVLSKFTGASFEEVGRLPFGLKLPKGTGTGTSNPRFVLPHGMVATKNSTILVNVGNIYEDNDDSVPENFAAGVWEWSQEFGFVHKYSLSYTPRETDTITDFGQYRFWQAGALANAQVGDDSADRNGTLLVGARYYTDSTVGAPSNYGIFYDDSNDLIRKRGYFVTTWFNSRQIQDKWERLWAVYRRFLSSGDSITFKYRLTEEAPVYAAITWTSTTTFTTTTDITAYGPTATGFNGTVGGEVEFIQGTGSGVCAHITAIVNNAGTYTVTLDTVVTGVTNGTGRARFQKWILLNPKDAQNQVVSYSQYGISASNIRVQIKGCMNFLGQDEFYKMALFSNEDIKISA